VPEKDGLDRNRWLETGPMDKERGAQATGVDAGETVRIWEPGVQGVLDWPRDCGVEGEKETGVFAREVGARK
jgi:hypothetical protein